MIIVGPLMQQLIIHHLYTLTFEQLQDKGVFRHLIISARTLQQFYRAAKTS